MNEVLTKEYEYGLRLNGTDLRFLTDDRRMMPEARFHTWRLEPPLSNFTVTNSCLYKTGLGTAAGALGVLNSDEQWMTTCIRNDLESFFALKSPQKHRAEWSEQL